jgi:hypothetical protein
MCERRKDGVEAAEAGESCSRCLRCRFRLVGEMAGDAAPAGSETAAESPEIAGVCGERELRAMERLSA